MDRPLGGGEDDAGVEETKEELPDPAPGPLNCLHQKPGVRPVTVEE